MRIPFVDLRAQYAALRPEVDDAMARVVESCQFVGGSAVKSFEENFANFSAGAYAVGTSSGTSAIHLGLVGLGIGSGDEVITACNTFIATTEAITHSGAKPVLIDVEDDTQLIDPAKIEAAITPRTKAIVPVHLYGQPANMDAIRRIASKHSLKILADACQAHGADIDGDRSNVLGDLTAYSFYPGKNLGAYGDAGAVVTDDLKTAKLLRALADHGSSEKYHHFAEGWNYRLDGIQGAVLDVKLKYLDEWTDKRRHNAARYDAAFDGTPVRPVTAVAGRRHVYHLYVVRVADRDGLGRVLGEKGIASGIHYPIPLHLQPAYKYLGLGPGSFPVAEKSVSEIISLPMYPELTDEMVDEVSTTVLGFVS